MTNARKINMFTKGMHNDEEYHNSDLLVIAVAF